MCLWTVYHNKDMITPFCFFTIKPKQMVRSGRENVQAPTHNTYRILYHGKISDINLSLFFFNEMEKTTGGMKQHL